MLIRRQLQHPALIIGMTRVANLALSILMVPLVIHGLGTPGFASWAILLGAAAIFAQLEGGMPTAFVRSMAVAAQGGSELIARSLWASLAGVAIVYAAVLPLVVAAAGPATAWIHLDENMALSPARVLLLVYLAVALRAMLQYGTHALVAAQAFPQVAGISFLQSFLSNLAASICAVTTRRVDTCVLVFWLVQLCVVAAGFVVASRKIALSRPRDVDWPLMRRLFSYSLRVQFSDLAQTVNFQFGKFVIAAFAGLHAVALYEVANRGVVALGSVPSSATEALLPQASRDYAKGTNLAATLDNMNTVATYGVIFFCLIPMAIAPMMLFAWVGELGYVGRWIFVILGLGMSASILALPGVVLSQAAGRPELQARAAGLSIALNIALTFELVRWYHLEGAAVGATLALALSAATVLAAAHHALGIPLRRSLAQVVARLCIPVVLCVACGLLVDHEFSRFLSPLPVASRYTVTLRAGVAAAAACTYVVCAALVVVAESLRLGHWPALGRLFNRRPLDETTRAS